MEFDQPTPANGITCLILAEHSATVEIDERDGTTKTFIVAK
jgi:hypothetical protein